MTYDYSNANGSPGPNAPISWLEKNIAMMTSGEREWGRLDADLTVGPVRRITL